jgi:pilus assembly protein Flp/PilA
MAIQLYNYLKLHTQALKKNEEGATMIEYGLLAALIGVALIAVIIFLSGALEGVFQRTGDAMNNAG